MTVLKASSGFTLIQPEVYVGPADVPKLLDLRFVVGMAVLVDLVEPWPGPTEAPGAGL